MRYKGTKIIDHFMYTYIYIKWFLIEMSCTFIPLRITKYQNQYFEFYKCMWGFSELQIWLVLWVNIWCLIRSPILLPTEMSQNATMYVFRSHFFSALLGLISPYICSGFPLIWLPLPFVVKPKIPALSVLVLWSKCLLENIMLRLFLLH